MRDYTLAHLSDAVLLRDLAALVAQDRVTTATLLAHIAEVDARRLYVPTGYASMHAYCVEEMRLSEDAAYKRIQAARAARQYPALFAALADGRLHLAAVCLLAPHLTAENAGELIEGATHRRKSEIEGFLAHSFPPPEVPALVRSLAVAHAVLLQLAPGQVGSESSEWICKTGDELAPGQVEEGRAKPALPSPERFLLEVTIGKSTREKLRYAQSLLSHAVPTGDVAQVLDRALDALIRLHEKRKIGAITRRPSPRGAATRPSPQGTTVRSRYVPAQVRRAVWERDQGQCTFAGSTEQAFGAGFMRRKRQETRLATAEARERAVAESRVRAAAKEQTLDVLAGLRELGCRIDQARRAAEFSETLHGATLEERMRASLRFLCGKAVNGPAQPVGGPHSIAESRSRLAPTRMTRKRSG